MYMQIHVYVHACMRVWCTCAAHMDIRTLTSGAHSLSTDQVAPRGAGPLDEERGVFRPLSGRSCQD